jgi:hypothetical protein
VGGVSGGLGVAGVEQWSVVSGQWSVKIAAGGVKLRCWVWLGEEIKSGELCSTGQPRAAVHTFHPHFLSLT